MARVPHPRFSAGEYERRYDGVCAGLDDQGLDALVVFGWSALGRARAGGPADRIEDSGVTIRDGLLHGFGIGLLPPCIRTQQTTWDDTSWVFEEGQTIVIQPNVITRDEKAGVQTRDLRVVTAGGCESPYRFPEGLIRAG